MLTSAIDPEGFVACVRPLLEARDLAGLLAFLKANYHPDQVVALLSCPRTDARNVAALALSLVGNKCCIPALAECLKDPDPVTNQMAEHALWCIWFRCGSEAANLALAHGAKCLASRRYDDALAHLSRAIRICPDLAEAYNQRGMVYSLLEDYAAARRDYEAAIRCMPWHFGAWAGLGHCYAETGNLAEAAECYERALAINPHLRDIRQAVAELRNVLGRNGGDVGGHNPSPG